MGARDTEAKRLRPTVPMKVPGAKAGGPPEQELTVVEPPLRATPKLPLPSSKGASKAAPPAPPGPSPDRPRPAAAKAKAAGMRPPPLPIGERPGRGDHGATQAIRGPAARALARAAAAPQMPRPFCGLREVDERLALFACAARKDGAQALLDGLAEGPRLRAKAHLARLLESPSAERQGLLARAFGVRPDAAGPLREVWRLAGPALRAEIYALLPPWLRTAFPDYAPPASPDEGAQPPAPGLAAFAERLVREATR